MNPTRVLLAEDDPAACTLMTTCFDRQPDFDLCAVAQNGFEALELLERERPDVLLLDLIMPGLDGLRVLELLRERPPARPVQIVVTTHIRACRIANLCLDLGADYVLIKPLDMSRLFSLLRTLRRDVLREKAQTLLLEMGAPRGSLGVEQGSIAAAALARTGGTMLLKQAYADAVIRGQTSQLCVEKNIRTMICAIHKTAAPAYRAMLGGLLPEAPPSNRVFLRRLASLLRA